MISMHYCEHCEGATVVGVSQRRYAEIKLTLPLWMSLKHDWRQRTQTDADGGSIAQ